MSGRWKLVQLPPLTHELIHKSAVPPLLSVCAEAGAAPHGRLPGASDARPSRYRESQYCLANVSRPCPRAATFASIISVFIWVRREEGLALPCAARPARAPQPIFRSCSARQLEQLGRDASRIELVAAVEGLRSAGARLLEPAPAESKSSSRPALERRDGDYRLGRSGRPCPTRGNTVSLAVVTRCWPTSRRPRAKQTARRGAAARPRGVGSAPRLWGPRVIVITAGWRRRQLKLNGLSHGPCPFRGAGQLTGRLPSGSAAPAAGLPRNSTTRRRR